MLVEKVRVTESAVIPVSFAGFFSSYSFGKRGVPRCYFPVVFILWILLSLLKPIVSVFGETHENIMI